MVKRFPLFFLCLLAGSAGPSRLFSQTLAGCSMFPANNVWNAPVDKLPLDPNSAVYVNTIGAARYLHPDFTSTGGGIPFTVVPGTQKKVPITFSPGGAESDPGPYPIPPNVPIESVGVSGSDRHILILENTNCILYEVFLAYPQADGSWTGYSGAVFNLKSNQLRPAGWTSADAAGFAILPGLIRYDEVAAGVINHALRMTVPQTRNQYIWPARHRASSLSGTQYPPMGQRFRLKASFDITPYPADVQVILKALKKYGAIVSDNGAPWFLTGAPDSRWNDDNMHKLHQILGSNMEAVDETGLMVDYNSGAVPAGAAALQEIQANPAAVAGGATAAGQVTLSAAAPGGGITVALSSSNLSAVSIPATVLVPVGATQASFSIQTGPVASATPVTLTAFYLGVSKTMTLTVNPVEAGSVTLQPSTVSGGAISTGVVTLTGKAPQSGAMIALASSNTAAATVPPSLIIPAGSSSGTFSVTSRTQTGTATTQISATYGASSTAATLTVNPAATVTAFIFKVSLTTIQSGTGTSAAVILSAPAPAGGVLVSVNTSDPAVTITPASGWTIAAGNTLKYISVGAPVTASQKQVTLTATVGGVAQSSVLTINPASLLGFSLSPTSVKGGAGVTGTIRLGGVAAPGGTVILLTSSLPALATVPASITVPAGSNATTFAVRTAPTASPAGVIIKAMQGGSAIPLKLTINP